MIKLFRGEEVCHWPSVCLACMTFWVQSSAPTFKKKKFKEKKQDVRWPQNDHSCAHIWVREGPGSSRPRRVSGGAEFVSF